MPSDPSLFYVTVSDYQTKSLQSLSGLSNDQIKALVLDAMSQVDSYVGQGWKPFDEDQEFIFPRKSDKDDDGNGFIPRAITSATIIIADSILLMRTKGFRPDDIQSESADGTSYTKRQKRALHNVIPDEAVTLLEKYRIGLGGILGL